MNRTSVILLIIVAGAMSAARVEAANGWHRKPTLPVATHADFVAARHAQTLSWHGPYAHTWYGMPVSLVVPPTAHMQTNWGWGVSQGSMTPIYHQFHRNYPGDFTVDGGAYGYAPTPRWPSHTSQFGVYYVRAPY
jgi:hypothetical protein